MELLPFYPTCQTLVDYFRSLTPLHCQAYDQSATRSKHPGMLRLAQLRRKNLGANDCHSYHWLPLDYSCPSIKENENDRSNYIQLHWNHPFEL